jgi:Zn-dependent M28 family amino/carboxypeptidase
MANAVGRWIRWLCLGAGVLLEAGSGSPAQTIRYHMVSRDAVEARLARYRGSNKERETTLKRMFAEAGCDEQHLSEEAVKGSRLPNVICVLPGSSEKTIIVGAHFDHVSEGDGVVDNWSGASLLPSLYEAVKSEPRKHSYIFIGFTDEEKGEVGSRFYAQKMTKEEVGATEAMVNMDTLGLAPAEIWTSHADQHLAGLFAAIAKQLNVAVRGVDVDQIGSSDSEQFRERKIASMTIHSLTQETLNARMLHTSKDKFSAMRLEDYYQTYRVIAAYLALLDDRAIAGKN